MTIKCICGGDLYSQGTACSRCCEKPEAVHKDWRLTYCPPNPGAESWRLTNHQLDLLIYWADQPLMERIASLLNHCEGYSPEFVAAAIRAVEEWKQEVRLPLSLFQRDNGTISIDSQAIRDYLESSLLR